LPNYSPYLEDFFQKNVKKVSESFAGFKKSCTFATAFQRKGVLGNPEKEPKLLERTH